MSLLVTGSIGIDKVVTPFGAKENILGGSALYFSWAAVHFCKVYLVGVVGEDFPSEFDFVFVHPNIDARGLERRKGSKTFRWAGRYDQTMNEATTTAVDLNVLIEKSPVIPAEYAQSRVVFLAATHPDLQMQLLSQVHKPKLVISDTRDLWIKNHRAELMKSLKKIDGLVLNDFEARLLTEKVNLVSALQQIRKLLKPGGPRLVVIKKGEHGCLAAYGNSLFAMPAYPTEKVVDPTGAGDSFAGGLLGYMTAQKRWSPVIFKQAVAAGTIMASFTIEDFSLEALRRANRRTIGSRMREFRKMVAHGLV